MGATLVEGAAMERPDLVRGLILIDGCLPSSVNLKRSFLLMALPFLGKTWYRAFRTNREGAYRSLFGYYADLEGMDAADREFLRERVMDRVESQTQERAYFASLRSMLWANGVLKGRFTRVIADFPGKLLLIWGEADRVFPPESARAIRDLRPGAAWSLIAGAGHLPHQEKPGETARAILDFLK
jgi:pimeloyl-ACP methyl ester carboxylesterase